MSNQGAPRTGGVARSTASKSSGEPLASRIGRPTFEPTADDRKNVAGMFGVGLSVEEVCRVVGISRPSLHKHFPDEIASGRDAANLAVKQSLFRKATAAKVSSASVKAIELWLKMSGDLQGSDISKKGQRDIDARKTPEGEWADLDPRPN